MARERVPPGDASLLCYLATTAGRWSNPRGLMVGGNGSGLILDYIPKSFSANGLGNDYFFLTGCRPLPPQRASTSKWTSFGSKAYEWRGCGAILEGVPNGFRRQTCGPHRMGVRSLSFLSNFLRELPHDATHSKQGGCAETDLPEVLLELRYCDEKHEMFHVKHSRCREKHASTS